ncbi:ABC transporter substrate-binding protein [Metapseudomonas resinovorans]|uniref:Putative amino acid ABC transporter substrate-binding protein n=1 Tax=Metapseudomonas resinovorans NBRC 106553 TaxID=1245471 RepID=S6APK4_METRE|nr:ABC transporter substrate-binding protein [Pseudomonas resinovorans]BAN47618.1 putative amino acid ABC transporter substrate-binding protein [Pseudomonas resinovorans NBRC 106553]
MSNRPLKLLALAGLAAATLSAGAMAESKPSFVSSGSFQVCSDPTFPPLEFFEKTGDREPSGFDADLIRAMAKHWGVKPRFIVTEFTGLLPGLDAKRCDAVISGTLITPERIQKLNAVPYLASSTIVFGSGKGDVKLNSLEDLSGKVVAVQSGTRYVTIMEKLNEQLKAAGKTPATLQTYPKGSDVAQQVLVGRAAAGLSQDTELAYRELQTPGQFKTLYAFPEKDIFGAYMRPNPEDKQAVLDAVAALKADGTLKAIAEKWKLDPANLDTTAQ